ncbi:hypothetical protein [Macromonas nakdongensis]|uniref:hypothetical protein n=1 Tax=Macromonas nakdongensis TaxID=1843082 RepID=UPI000C34DC3A|nr:hypothetical protein [Macromonas nakdongensis]
MTVPVLFTRKTSPYLALGCDCYDADRDALTWPGGRPLIAHPPCRSWGQLSHMAKPRPGERELATWAIAQVRLFGGALEHPINSRLWNESGCLSWGVRDQYGGVLVPLYQSAFGHRAPKATALYLVGTPVPEIPEPRPTVTTVERMGRPERERTPPELAAWLVDLVGAVQ